MESLLLAGCFLFVLLAVLGVGYWFMQEPQEAEDALPSSITLDQDDGTIRQTLEKIGSILPSANDLEHPIRKRLSTAGYRSPDALQAYFGIKAVAALLGALVLVGCGLASGSEVVSSGILAVCGAGFGYMVPERLLTIAEKKRKLKLRQGLPAALDLLVLSLEAGQGLDTSLLDTGRELKGVYPDLSEELSLSHLQTRAGKSRQEVLEGLAVRTGEPEIRKLTNLLLDGDRFGTALGPALRNHAKYTRLRRRQLAQEQARKTSVKLVFPVFFLIFPSVLLVTLGPAVLRLMQGMRQLMAN